MLIGVHCSKAFGVAIGHSSECYMDDKLLCWEVVEHLLEVTEMEGATSLPGP